MFSGIPSPRRVTLPLPHQEIETESDRSGLSKSKLKRRTGSHDQSHRCKRRCSEDIERDECDQTGRISSLLETVETLKLQVSCLQRLLDGHTLQLSTQFSCRAVSCKKEFKRLEHLYRHIRDQKHDPAHEPLAILIDETHCVKCSTTYSRSTDLVRHEKQLHRETYISRLDKFLNPLMPPSPPSSTSEAVDVTCNR